MNSLVILKELKLVKFWHFNRFVSLLRHPFNDLTRLFLKISFIVKVVDIIINILLKLDSSFPSFLSAFRIYSPLFLFELFDLLLFEHSVDIFLHLIIVLILEVARIDLLKSEIESVFFIFVLFCKRSNCLGLLFSFFLYFFVIFDTFSNE